MSSLRQKISTLVKGDPLLVRVLRNTGYLFSSQSLGMLLALGQSILAARLLGSDLFGVLTIVMAFAANINRLFSFRMGEFVIRFMGRELEKKEYARAGAIAKVAGMTEGLTSILAFLIYMLLVPLGARLFAKDLTTVPLFQLYGLYILANLTTETATGILQLHNQFKVQARINIAQSLLTAGLIAIAFFTRGTLEFVLWAYLIGKWVTGMGPIIAAAVVLDQKMGRGWWRSSLSLLPPFRELVGFAFSTNLSGTVKMLVSESEPLLIGYFLNTQAVALYKIAINVVNPLMIPISQFINTTFPEMTKSIVSKKWKELRRLLRGVTLISGAWTIVFFLIMLVLGPWILSFWGGEYVAAYPTMMILIVGYGIANIFFWNRTLLLSFGKANIPLFVLLAVAILKTLSAFYFVPLYGINAEAALLSGNFVLSVGILVAIGLGMIRKFERETKAGTAE
ncbi:MAG: oligosaccharide flippase family protein [Chloroflexi bacterium]|nr:oligosaccharide flippase family protein [Chloroflexota bacterium]